MPIINIDDLWDDYAAKLETAMLENIRAIAEKWTATLATLTGLVSIGTLFGANDAFDALQEPWKTLFAISLLIALLCTVVSLFYGALASQGFPESGIPFTGTNIKVAVLKRSNTARTQLTNSRNVVIPALAFAFVASAILLFGRTASQKGLLYGESASGEVICGSVIILPDKTIGIDSVGKQQTLVRAKNLMPIDYCPENK